MIGEVYRAALREQSQALIARADATLALPRPDEDARARAEAWTRERAASAAVSGASAAEAPAADGARRAAGATLSRAELDRRQAALEKAVASALRNLDFALLRRVNELERRIAELEGKHDG